MAAALVASGAFASAACAADAGAPLGATIATVHDRSGWAASVLVAPPERRNFLEDPAVRTMPPVVNATISRPLTKSAHVGFDVTNVFDREASTGRFLEPPSDKRGFGIHFRLSF